MLSQFSDDEVHTQVNALDIEDRSIALYATFAFSCPVSNTPEKSTESTKLEEFKNFLELLAKHNADLNR